MPLLKLHCREISVPNLSPLVWGRSPLGRNGRMHRRGAAG